MVENLLPGGHVNPVVRVGDTVRRTTHATGTFAHELLLHLEACAASIPCPG